MVCDLVFRFTTELRGSQLPTALYQSAGPTSGGDSDGSLGNGSVTNIIERIGEREPGAVHDLFERVQCPLRDKAHAILRGYPNARGVEADELVSEIFSVLKLRIKNGAIQNRQDLYATACRNFRWKLWEIVRGNPPPSLELSFSDPEGDEESPAILSEKAEEIARLLEGLECLDQGYRQIVEMHNYLDMTFEEIGQELGLPKSTVYDRYRKALAMLKGFLK